MSSRRFFLRAQRCADALAEDALVSALRTKQLGVPGTPLPADFPCRTKLEAAGYFAFEDLDPGVPLGVDVDELVREANLTLSQAKAVIAAALEH